MSAGPSTAEYEQDVFTLCNCIGVNVQTIKNNTLAIEKALKIIGTNLDNTQYRENA